MNDMAIAIVAAPLCPRCCQTFDRRRKDQRYCSKPCARAATRHASRGSRAVENAGRLRRHYERAAWLSYALNRTQPWDRRSMLLKLVIAAKFHDAKLRNILTDPRLLGADRCSSIGKLYPDSRNADVLNIAKLANEYCRERWGVSIKSALDKDSPVTPDEAEAEFQGPIMETYWQRLRREGRL